MRFSIKYLEVSFFCCIFVSEIKNKNMINMIIKAKRKEVLKKNVSCLEC